MINNKTWELAGAEEIQAVRERGKCVITCDTCGKSKIVSPSQTDRKHCSPECRAISIAKRKEFCATPGCDVKITKASAYARSNGSLDNYCKKCRTRINSKPKIKAKKQAAITCRGEGRPRGKLNNWTAAMLKHPFYFADIFHKPATPENVAREAARLGM
jgi:hypothetical protein